MTFHGNEKIAPPLTSNWMDHLHPIKENPSSCVEGCSHDCNVVLQVGFEVEIGPYYVHPG
jgi:hypothetical protein